MAAFGITFPKLSLCRSTKSKVDTNTISTTTTTTPTPTPTTATSTRTLSLSIKNVPSQPLHYDISATTAKKKTTSILAIDGETKKLPKNLSVFNELQLDDEPEDIINEKKKQEGNSNDVIVPSSLSPMRTIIHRPDIRYFANIDSKKVLDESKERRSNHTFTPPTSSLSHNSSSNDLHLTSSALSIDLPQLKYAIEKFLVDDDDNPVYQVVDEFQSGCSLFHQDHNETAHSSNMTKSDPKHQQNDKVDNIEFHSMYNKNTNDEVEESRPTLMSNNVKWYVSELRIHRPLIYRMQWANEQQRSSNRKLSHSVNDLKHIYNFSNCPENNQAKKRNNIAYSTLSLQNFINQQQQQYRHQSDDNILLNKHVSSTDDDLNNFHSDEDDQNLSSLNMPRTIGRSIGKDDTLIRNESVKKKLFDILNDDELENACLEDMSEEFEKMSLADYHHHHHHRDIQALNSFSSSSDDALYSSPPTEPYHIPLLPPPPPPLSSSCNEILSANIHNTTERCFGRSRLITTSLDKIPMINNNNNNAYDHSSSTCLLRPSYKQTRPSWYTSPSPQWRMDDQLPIVWALKRHSSKNNDHLNGIDANQFLSTKLAEYDMKENNNLRKYNHHHHHHHQKEQKHINYTLMTTSTSSVDNSATVLPIIQDKSSNLLMFI